MNRRSLSLSECTCASAQLESISSSHIHSGSHVHASDRGAISISSKSKVEDEPLLPEGQTAMSHLSEQLANSVDRIKVQTRHGVLTGARATNGAIAFLGSLQVVMPGSITFKFSLDSEAPILRQSA